MQTPGRNPLHLLLHQIKGEQDENNRQDIKRQRVHRGSKSQVIITSREALLWPPLVGCGEPLPPECDLFGYDY